MAENEKQPEGLDAQAINPEIARLRRDVSTLQSQVADLVQRLSAFQVGSKNNPMKGLYVADTKGSGVAIFDFDAVNTAVRVTKVR